jgi:hypothetical protein
MYNILYKSFLLIILRPCQYARMPSSQYARIPSITTYVNIYRNRIFSVLKQILTISLFVVMSVYCAFRGPLLQQRCLLRRADYLPAHTDVGGWSAPRPGRFTQYPLYMRLGEPQGRSVQVRKTSPPPGFDPRTVLITVLD